MGYFNTTCFVSQQTIVPGAEVVIIPIVQQSTFNRIQLSNSISEYGVFNTTCYPTAFWGHSGPIIRGNYDDYGLFDILDTPDNHHNFVHFFNYLYEESLVTKKGENQYHDTHFDMKMIYIPEKEYTFKELHNIWDNILEVSSNSRLFVYNYFEKPSCIQFAVMHKSAANYLIDFVNNIKTFNGSSYEQRDYFNSYINKKSQILLKALNSVANNNVNIGFEFEILAGYHIGTQEGCYISDFYNYFEQIKNLFTQFSKNKVKLKEIPQEFLDKMFDIFKTEIDHRYIHVGLDALNIKLSPMVYASQDYSNTIGKNYAKMVQSVKVQVNKQIKLNG